MQSGSKLTNENPWNCKAGDILYWLNLYSSRDTPSALAIFSFSFANCLRLMCILVLLSRLTSSPLILLH